jgi:hypothetical protein
LVYADAKAMEVLALRGVIVNLSVAAAEPTAQDRASK